MATDREPPRRRPLGAVVPTLAALADRPARRRGFTLVELMVAVALSTVIVLTAVTCFRMVSKAVASANAMSVENGLLRSGFMLALQDVDYWHSHANANAPYNKGFMRQQTRRDNAATTDFVATSKEYNGIAENTWRRPFQPVRYAPRTDPAERDPFPSTPAPVTGAGRNAHIYNAAAPTSPNDLDNWHSDAHFTDQYNRNDVVPNPNALLAHDPRAISRMTARPMRVPDVAVTGGPSIYDVKHYGGYRLGASKLVSGDYSLVSSTDMRDTAHRTVRYPTNSTPPVVRKQMEFWMTTGEPDVVRTFVDTPLAGVDIPIDNGWGMYQPLLWQSMWQRLNYFGLFQYMTPGTAVLWNTRFGRTADNNTVPLPPFTYRRNGATRPAGELQYGYVPDGDAGFNIGTCDLATRMGERFLPSASNGGRHSRAVECIPLPPCWPAQGSDGDFNYGQSNFDYRAWRTPFEIFIGTGSFDWNGGSDNANMFAAWTLGVQLQVERADVTRTDTTNLSTTVWLPYNLTDADRAEPDAGTSTAPTTIWYSTPRPLDFTSKPPQSPIMSTSIMRYGRVAGAQDITVTRVVVEDQNGARKVELPCLPFGTTFRGARQHWRLYSRGLTTINAAAPGHLYGNVSDECIGDFYDTANGPYYVP